MGKKGPQTSSLGRSIIKDRFGKKNRSGNSLLHTSELEDGQDWNRINFQSVTDQTHIEEFLATAELAGTEFAAEKLNMNFVRPTIIAGMLTDEEKKKIQEAQDANRELLGIPRRPPWNITTTAEQLAEAERDSFLSWRRNLSQLQEVDGITLTPFEKNLEFWRQLWRVIEKSDVVVQILDSRNPLLFRCEDLEAYVKEVNPDKDNLLLINKSDFLTESQREAWAEYFRQKDIKAVFFSALNGEELDAIKEEEEEKTNSETEEEEELTDREDNQDLNVEECRQDLENLSAKLKENSSVKTTTDTTSDGEQAALPVEADDKPSQPSTTSTFTTSSRMLSRSELMEVFRTIYTKKRVLDKSVTIGLVGYPNVGKSSTINCLMQEKKVSVSATPGKTKHFQTLFLTDDILLCDCPGLVFPAFVATKQEMIISGILPIDQMRDEVPPVNLVASQIPREVFENMYGITLPPPLEGEDPQRPPTSEELLNAYGLMRGYMTQRGLPDNPRSSRYILKDYMNGKLLYAHAPPTTSQAEYHKYTLTKMRKTVVQKPTPQQMATRPYQIRPETIDRKFFATTTSQFHIKGINKGGPSRVQNGSSVDDQPRKKNFKKREKLRRRFAHLDQ
ncbi:large subunit GTPase 1 homolog [Homarus americanus]|uniref:Large subunit GTPase 1 homolog n=1 Tax=Homarus americanus TaxID=6706 RepID=A0A8J5K407_HOMAM|nr:large subunit GTPase 1 homolog [Homarus americanus]KAG7166198.1 Large subunit GTPase 1-like [Homarus americanus]